MKTRIGTSLALGVRVATVLAVFGVAAGCSSDDDDDGGMMMEPPPQSGVVEIQLTDGLRFEPDDVAITPGTMVRWVTVSSEFHTITPRDDEQPGVWDRQPMPEDAPAFEHTFNVAGQVYDYFCEPHETQDMLGTITVVEE